MIIKSKNALEILKPSNIELLFSITAIISYIFHQLTANAKFFFNESINTFEKLIGKSFHIRTSILIGIENLESVCFSLCVSFLEDNSWNLKSIRNDSIDNHSFVTTLFSDQNADFIHISIEFIWILFSFSWLLLSLFSLVFSKVSWSFDVWEEMNFIFVSGFSEFN